MEEKVILSICIPSHNRVDVILENLKDILKVSDDRFDIIITDSSNYKGELDKLLEIKDKRVKIFRNNVNCTAMENWFQAIENGDGIFAIHLNDRDKIVSDNLQEFLTYLDMHHMFSGGVCKEVSNSDEAKEFYGTKDAMMNMAYFDLHPTGIVFNLKCWRKISDRKELFSYEKSGYFPHDIVLGRLALMGDMFIYQNCIWKMASPEFCKKNLSGTGMRNFFEPSERLFALQCCLRELEKAKINQDLRKNKYMQTIETHLNLATVGYFHYKETEFEAIHFGYSIQKFNMKEKMGKIREVLKMYKRELGLAKEDYSKIKKWTYKNFFVTELRKRTLWLKNRNVRKFLRALNTKRKSKEGSLLR